MSNRGHQTPRGPRGRFNQPCHEFRQKGRCGFGTRCKYSHDLPPHRTQPSTDATAHSRHGPGPSRKQFDGKLREWKRLLVQGEPPSQPTPDAVQRFFSLGCDLMDGDLGAAHEAVKLLATEGGLSFIKTLADRQIHLTHTSLRSAFWTSAVRPLFRLMTHPRFVDSAVLEQEVASCFNFLFGVGGTRIERLCGYITNLLGSWDDRVMQPLSKMEVVELSLAVLSKILDFNTTTIVNERFAKVVLGFSTILNQNPATNPDNEFSHRQASKYLDYIQRRLQVGNGIATFQGHSSAPVTREQFVLRRDGPGSLSADGPRHDNDHADITKIRILPTYDEIVSPRAEYLPTKDPSDWHIEGILGRLDREFRLIREDTVGQLRDAVRDLLDFIRNPGKAGSHQGAGQSKNSARTVSYDTPELVDVEFERHGGLELTVRCAQIPALRNVDVRSRRQWWDQCKRLQAGALVCVLDASGTILFCVVSDSTMRSVNDKKGPGRKKDQGDTTTTPLTLSDDADFLYFRLQLVASSPYEIRQALRWFQPVSSSPRRYLVEFPGVLLASFQHTLTALQQMYRKPDIPFHNILAPTAPAEQEQDMKPPQYARKPGFIFDARCLTKNGGELVLTPGNPANPRLLEEKTILDPTQSTALDDSLSRELALIQGPPGTGKSFTGEKLIELLLDNRNKARLGPILCVCYTNHALDQLLEHLLDARIEGIIRIGSRSKSERLENLNLRAIAMVADRTKTERKDWYELDKEQIPEKVKEGTDALNRLAASQHWRTVQAFLAQNYPHHHQELFGKEEDGWQRVSRSPEKTIDGWLRSGNDTRTSRPVDTLELAHLSTMTNGERKLLYRFWLKSIRDPIVAEIVNISREHARMTEQRNRLRGDVDLRCLQDANVVGVTTTGLARQLETLRKLRCKVLVCEEAGEVLEAHILTALLPSVEHAILIGDHLQLRPQIQNYELQSVNPRGERYSLDMSLFERLVQPPSNQSNGSTTSQLPFSALETQRRMHPSISDLVRKTLYPALKDGPNVLAYPEVVGMRKRLFWMHHEFPEAGSANSHDTVGTSHTNTFEVEMTIALVSHLVRQGEYGKDDIAVITPYLGQLQKLRRSMQSMFEICLNDRDQEEVEALENTDPDSKSTASEISPGQLPRGQRSGVAKTALLNSIRVATVDNFQGEEAKVVIISLVRSNPQQNCGFLRTSNRINVLLSRAKHGMYIIGNANTYGNVSMWTDVLGMLRQEGNFGTAFELQCPRHPATPLQVSSPDHFMQFSPESGCNLPCYKRLRCGHTCTGRCHSQLLHDALKCLEACPRPLDGGSCDHPCPLRCGDSCPAKCVVRLTGLNITLPCGHKLASAKCWETRDLSGIKCQAQVDKTVPGCGHKVQVKCHVDVNDASYRCLARCGQTWSTCGHTCASLCYQCRPDRKKNTQGVVSVTPDHPICLARCGRNYKNCRHSCEKKCHGEDKACPPCKRPCEVRCGHSKCSKECNEPCAPCAQTNCHSKCPHGGCTMPCAAPCNWIPCSQRCEKKLDCGHQCPSVCGERCPASKYCQQCASETIKATCVDFLEMKDYRDIDLNEEPCIFPDCGHFLTVTSMDGQMDMGGHYRLDANGLPVAINKASEPFSMDQGEAIRVCPTCRGSLRNIARYGRIVRRCMLDEATKKFISWSNEKYLVLAEQVVAEQERLASLEMPKVPSRSAAVVVAAATAAPIGTGSSSGSKWVSPRAVRLRQLEYLQTLVQPGGADGTKRYAAAIKLWTKISAFAGEVRKEEQPFQRVADLVRHSNRLRRDEWNAKRIDFIAAQLKTIHGTDGQTIESRDETSSKGDSLAASGVEQLPIMDAGEMETTEFVYDESVIQLKGQLLATSLLLRCEIIVFEDLLRLLSEKTVVLPTAFPLTGDGSRKRIGGLGCVLGGQVDIGVYLRDCEKMVMTGETAKHPKECVLGHLFHARFCGFAITLAREEGQTAASQLAVGSGPGPTGTGVSIEEQSSDDSKNKTKLKEEGLSHLAAARAVTERYPSTVAPPSTLAAEIEAAERFLTEGTFYEAVSAAELRAVYQAMSREFRGTGHWYTCENGHPFTVGECGMPMQQARCPECGGVVGGTDHQNAPGVRRDETMEAMARGVHGLRI